VPTTLILTYLAAAYKANPDAEVSGVELRHELGLDKEAVDNGVAELAGQGLVEWDPLLSNVWLRLTDKGIALASRGL
jgi:DNA-binding MarR family transcriptional regulator